MRVKGRQLRFLLASLAAWTAARMLAVWGGAGPAAVIASHHRLGDPGPVKLAERRSLVRALPQAVEPAPLAKRSVPAVSVRLAANLPLAPPIAWPAQATVQAEPSAPDVTSQAAVVRPPAARPSRWAGSAYLFLRPGSGQAALAAGGALGGSQAAARLTYRLNSGDAMRLALAARLYAPLSVKGAEAAIGIDWHPLPSIPFRLSLERRRDLDGAGRSAWSAYAAGGFYAEPAGRHLVLDGYGQAGVVGVHARDLFVDGAVRAGTPLPVGGSARLVLGGGLWGAAQPGVARLDVGPRASLSLPIARHGLTAALEGRFRLAGRAAPGSGAALTLAADF